jgi:hypothetical protein
MKEIIDNYKRYNIPIEERMFIVPLSFSTLHKQLLQQAKWITELTDDSGKAMMGIHPRYDKLLTGLRTAVSVENSLDKSSTSFNDLVDSYRMATYYIKRKRQVNK